MGDSLSYLDLPLLQYNRPYHGFQRHFDEQAKRSEITVFVWESDGKLLFPKLNFTQFVNQNVKILGRRLYSPSLKYVAWLADAQLIFLIFHTFVCNRFSREPHLDVRLPCQMYRQIYEKLDHISRHFVSGSFEEVAWAVYASRDQHSWKNWVLCLKIS